jgi:hypothetical protein
VPVLPGGDANFETAVEMGVDGKTVARETLRPGDFELRGDVPLASATASVRTHAVELKFSRLQHLPENNGYPDGRPVAARLHYMGLRPPAAESAQLLSRASR